MSFFRNASNFNMDNVDFRNIQGDYLDRRSYNTVNDESVNNSLVYHQQNSKAGIYNGSITGGVKTYTGGNVAYSSSRPNSIPQPYPAQMASQIPWEKKATHPTGTYYQNNAAGPIYNGEIEGGVTSYTNTNVTYGYDDEGRNDDPGYHQHGGWPDHQAHGQYFNTAMSAEPGNYSWDPASEGVPSHSPESYNLSSGMGSAAFQRRPPYHRAGWDHNCHVASQDLPRSVDTRPPSISASSHDFGIPPIHEGPPSTGFANAYPSPASSQDGQPIEESCANSEGNGCLAPDSVSNGIRKLSLDDKADRDLPKYIQFPPTPHEPPHQMPQRTWSAKNPFIPIMEAERRAAQSRRTCFN
ncbi:hypothetical protein EST38_g14581 [Candolleomyces aberdarensis]|uniref:Uncharacterized protein n=1 Tax=Candolleomyces aberdarensis TaxID=2316362 RepID=A0A4Q2CZB1_9AGAR|nr:hypothetical protein EST38_g14581 [Candolleomyces aberdarensis]